MAGPNDRPLVDYRESTAWDSTAWDSQENKPFLHRAKARQSIGQGAFGHFKAHKVLRDSLYHVPENKHPPNAVAQKRCLKITGIHT